MRRHRDEGLPAGGRKWYLVGEAQDKGSLMRRTTTILIGVLMLAAACGKTDKFSEHNISLGAETETMKIPAQDAIVMPFSGSVEDIPKAAEMLYVEMRRAGRYFGGPLRIECTSAPDWKDGRIAGRILFPLAPGEGAKEYLDRPASSTTPEFVRVSGGTFRTIVYTGPLAALEAGHQRLRERVGGAADTCTFVFEDTLKNIEKRYRVRVMARTGE